MGQVGFEPTILGSAGLHPNPLDDWPVNIKFIFTINYI